MAHQRANEIHLRIRRIDVAIRFHFFFQFRLFAFLLFFLLGSGEILGIGQIIHGD